VKTSSKATALLLALAAVVVVGSTLFVGRGTVSQDQNRAVDTSPAPAERGASDTGLTGRSKLAPPPRFIAPPARDVAKRPPGDRAMRELMAAKISRPTSLEERRAALEASNARKMKAVEAALVELRFDASTAARVREIMRAAFEDGMRVRLAHSSETFGDVFASRQAASDAERRHTAMLVDILGADRAEEFRIARLRAMAGTEDLTVHELAVRADAR
jgi:hypothetical protein